MLCTLIVGIIKLHQMLYLIDYYVKQIQWSQESITEIANKSVIWWNTYNVDNRPQTREIPIGWCIIKYKNGYILSYSPYPTTRKLHFTTEIDKSITIYSFYKINWDEFINHVKEHYYNEIISSRMITYNCNCNGYTWSENCLDLRPMLIKVIVLGIKQRKIVGMLYQNSLILKRKKDTNIWDKHIRLPF